MEGTGEKVEKGENGDFWSEKGNEGRSYGHRKLIVWQNLDELEAIVQKKIISALPKNQYSLIDQIDRSCSSALANLIEGYYSNSTKEYVRFLNYSRRSLAELQDWIRRCYHKSFIGGSFYNEVDDLISRTQFLQNRLIDSLKRKIAST